MIVDMNRVHFVRPNPLVRRIKSMPSLSDKKGKRREEYIALLAKNLSNCSEKTRIEVLKYLPTADKLAVMDLLKSSEKRLA